MNVVCSGVQSPYRRSRPLPRRGARANGTRPLDGAASLFRPSLGMEARKPLGNDAGAKQDYMYESAFGFFASCHGG